MAAVKKGALKRAINDNETHRMAFLLQRLPQRPQGTQSPLDVRQAEETIRSLAQGYYCDMLIGEATQAEGEKTARLNAVKT